MYILLKSKKLTIIYAKRLKGWWKLEKILSILTNEIKKYSNFDLKLGKLAVQLEDEYYKKGRNA